MLLRAGLTFALLAVGVSCSGLRLRGEVDTLPGKGNLDIQVGQGGQSDAHSVVVTPSPAMYGLCVVAGRYDGDGQFDTGPPTLLRAGMNPVEVPAGIGPIHTNYFEWEPPDQESSLPAKSPSSVPEKLYLFDQWPTTFSPDAENVSFFAEIRATDMEQARSRLLDLLADHELLLLGIDPGPLPDYVGRVHFVSFRLLSEQGQPGPLLFSVAKPGTRVDAYSLQVNDFEAGLEASSSSSIGAWQRVTTRVPAEEVDWALGVGDLALNEFDVLFDTDRGDALPLRASLEIELSGER